MKVKLKYPIFWSSPNDNRVYVFWKEDKTTKLDMLKEANGWKGDIIIDATGTKYIIKCSYMTKWKGIHGFTGGFTGMIYYEQEYEDNPESFSLRQLQDRIAERYPKTRGSKRKVGAAGMISDERSTAARPLRSLQDYSDVHPKLCTHGL